MIPPSLNLLGKIIAALLKDTVLGKWLYGLDDAWVKNRQAQQSTDCATLYDAWQNSSGLIRYYYWERLLFRGCPEAKEIKARDTYWKTFRANPSLAIAKAMEAGLDNEGVKEFFESFGALIYDSVLRAALPNFPDAKQPELEGVRQFIGSVSALSMLPSLASPAIEAVTGGFIKNGGEPLRNLYFNLGLGFITWQMTSPLIDGGIGAQLDRVAKKHYRPTRMGLSQLMDIYALGRISQEELVSSLGELGWRTSDINHVVALSYTKIGLGQAIDLYHKGLIDEVGFKGRVRQLGYNSTDTELLFRLNPKLDEEEEKKTLVSTVTQAFEDAIIVQSEYVALMEKMGYSQEEIDLRASITIGRRNDAVKRAAKGDVERAYKEGLLGLPEVQTYLRKAGYNDESIKLFYDTWSRELQPEPLRLNRATLLQAYDANVLTRDNVKARLVGFGYTVDQAEIILKTHDTLQQRRNVTTIKPLPITVILNAYDAKIGDRTLALAQLSRHGYSDFQSDYILRTHEAMRSEPKVTPARKLSQSTILDAYRTDILTETQAKARLKTLGYVDTDVTVILETFKRLIAQVPEVISKELSRSSIERAYQLGLITRTLAKTRLTTLGYTLSDAELLIATIDKIVQISNQTVTVDTPRQTVLQALEYKLLTRSVALTHLTNSGFSEIQASLIVDTHLESVRRRNLTVPPKISVSQLIQAYTNSLITKAALLSAITNRGYNSTDANLIVNTAEKQKVVVVTSVVKRLDRNTLFDAYNLQVITSAQLHSGLVSLGYKDSDVLVLRTLNTRMLAELNRVELSPNTKDEVTRAYRLDLITRAQAVTLLQKLLLEPEAIILILDTVERELALLETDQRQKLSRSDVQNAYRYGVISREQAIDALVSLNINLNDANLLLQTIDNQMELAAIKSPLVLSKTIVLSAYLENLIPRSEALQRLRDDGYTAQDVELLLDLADSQRPTVETVPDAKLSLSTVLNSLGYGVITEAVARAKIATLGYNASDVDIILQTWHESRQVSTEEAPKELSKELILQMLDSEVLTREEATSRLSTLGYDLETITLILVQFDRMREQTPTDQPLQVNRSTVIEAYRLDMINRQQAIDRLVSLGYTAVDAEFILDVETTVGETPTPEATVEQWVEALKKGLITVEIFREGLRSLGIDEETIRTLEAMALAETARPGKDLTVSNIQTLYKEGKINRSSAISQLTGLGYDPVESENLLFLAIDRLTLAALQNLMVQKNLQYPQLLELLSSRGYDQVQGRDILWSLVPKSSTSQILSLYANNGFPREQIVNVLKEHGYDAGQIELLLLLGEPTP